MLLKRHLFAPSAGSNRRRRRQLRRQHNQHCRRASCACRACGPARSHRVEQRLRMDRATAGLDIAQQARGRRLSGTAGDADEGRPAWRTFSAPDSRNRQPISSLIFRSQAFIAPRNSGPRPLVPFQGLASQTRAACVAWRNSTLDAIAHCSRYCFYAIPGRPFALFPDCSKCSVRRRPPVPRR